MNIEVITATTALIASPIDPALVPALTYVRIMCKYK
jgi:hypothetical protein